MKNLRFILSVVAVLFGLAIVGASLSSASLVQGQAAGASTKTLYWSQTILPDHVLYPFVAASDRIKLEAAADSERPYMQIDYAKRRLGYAKQLLEKDQKALALTALTKSQKYLIYATQEVINDKTASQTTKKHLDKALGEHLEEVKAMLDQFSPSERDVLKNLCTETQSLKEKLLVEG